MRQRGGYTATGERDREGDKTSSAERPARHSGKLSQRRPSVNNPRHPALLRDACHHHPSGRLAIHRRLQQRLQLRHAQRGAPFVAGLRIEQRGVEERRDLRLRIPEGGGPLTQLVEGASGTLEVLERELNVGESGERLLRVFAL